MTIFGNESWLSSLLRIKQNLWRFGGYTRVEETLQFNPNFDQFYNFHQKLTQSYVNLGSQSKENVRFSKSSLL